jgi:hypothetical protein
MRQNRIRLTSSLLLVASIVGLVVGVAAAQIDLRAFIGLATFECAVGLAFMRIRCEYCRQPVHKRRRGLLGSMISTWSVSVPRRCPGCDAPIPWWGSSQGARTLTPRIPLSRRSDREGRVVLVLVILAVANFLGGIGLALVVDHRLIWIAVAIPCAAIGGIVWTRRCHR